MRAAERREQAAGAAAASFSRSVPCFPTAQPAPRQHTRSDFGPRRDKGSGPCGMEPVHVRSAEGARALTPAEPHEARCRVSPWPTDRRNPRPLRKGPRADDVPGGQVGKRGEPVRTTPKPPRAVPVGPRRRSRCSRGCRRGRTGPGCGHTRVGALRTTALRYPLSYGPSLPAQLSPASSPANRVNASAIFPPSRQD